MTKLLVYPDNPLGVTGGLVHGRSGCLLSMEGFIYTCGRDSTSNDTQVY